MRKSKYLIAGIAAVALSVAVSSVAQAATFQSQSLVVTPSSPKQDKKKPGAISSLVTDVITAYTNTPASVPDRYATNTKVYFTKDFVFNTAGLAQCDPNASGFASGTTANAIAVCGTSQVSSAGSATLEGPVAGVTAVVTAFNGTQPAGQPTILLHSQSSAGPSLLLTGTLKPSDVGGFGKMLDVPVDLGPFQGAEAITDFKVTIKKLKLPAGGKAASSAKKKKKKKAPKYYIMAKCSNKTWNFQAVTTYNTGAPTTATSKASCKQKATKKKKK
jgi:hypothetical protein